jgi:2-amino-4-hydroxy-6-hydroxymethyldihydropteridine diphosphokinase
VTEALIAFGANLGDPARMFDETATRLESSPGIAAVRKSSLHRTVPVGGPAGQPEFFNGAFALETTLDAGGLFAAMRNVEADLGRTRKEQWGPRTIDLDLVLFGGEIRETESLATPHPRMHFRKFVLAPAAEVAPEMVHPLLEHDVRELHCLVEQIALGEVLLAIIIDEPDERRAAGELFVQRFPQGSFVGLPSGAVPGTAIVHSGAVVGLRPPIHLPGVEDRKLERDLDRVWEAASTRRLWIASSENFLPAPHPMADRIVPVVDLHAKDASGRMKEFVNFLDGIK